MTDLELAEEIERKLGNMAEDFRWAITFSSSKWQQIIAALRRGPVCERCQGKGGLADWQGNWRPCPVCQDKRPPSGEMVMVPRPTGMLKPFEVIGARLLAQFDNRFGIANPIQFTDNERQVIVAALKILLAALSAAEAEGRKS